MAAWSSREWETDDGMCGLVGDALPIGSPSGLHQWAGESPTGQPNGNHFFWTLLSRFLAKMDLSHLFHADNYSDETDSLGFLSPGY